MFISDIVILLLGSTFLYIYQFAIIFNKFQLLSSEYCLVTTSISLKAGLQRISTENTMPQISA